MRFDFLYLQPVYRLFLAACLLLITGFVSAQDGWLPDEYTGIPAIDRSQLIHDEFESIPLYWESLPSYQRETVAHSEWTCQSVSSVTTVRQRSIPIDMSESLEIEALFGLEVKDPSESAGIFLGTDRQGLEYYFWVNARQEFAVVSSNHGRLTPIVPFTYSEHLNKFAYNLLTFRQANNKWFFFLNRHSVATTDLKPIAGKSAGFVFSAGAGIKADFFQLSSFRVSDRLGPRILLTEPDLRGSNQVVFNTSQQKIQGRVSDISGVTSLKINGNPISIINQGEFIASVDLPPGPTEILLEATDKSGNLTQQKFQMIYRPGAPAPTQNEVSGLGYSGKNYLLLIGIDQYRIWNPLHNAVRDCNDLRTVLTTEYQFNNTDVMTLYNTVATRENIQDSLEKLKNMLTSEDNLVIYYAGHGYFDPTADLGFWVPVDARLNKVPDFIRNSTLNDYIKSIKTRHTFLIADACYAGSLFSSTRAVINEGNKSRWAFTSGSIEKVLDGQPGENSPFAKYLINYLHNNPKRNIRADELINAVSPVVQRNTSQTPLGSSLQGVGDEGGVFIFYRK